MLTIQKNTSEMSSTLLSVSVMVLALSVVGCACQDKRIVPVKPPVASKPADIKPAPQAENVVPPPAPIIEQYALDRLKQMSEKLTAAKSFTYHANSLIELPAKTGQFLTFFTDTKVALQRPNKLRVDVSGDVPSFQFYFNGEKIAAFDPEKNVHASSEAGTTIDEMLDVVINKANINFPSADFMYSDPYAVMTKNLTHAIVVGESMVNGVPAEHFAYMEPAINWEIWIEKGKNALPLRLAMTYKQEANFPRYLVEYADWNLNPKLKANTFVFKAPANAQRIEFDTYRIEPKAK